MLWHFKHFVFGFYMFVLFVNFILYFFTDHFSELVKDSGPDIWYFGIWCESLVEVTVQNSRLFFLKKKTLKTFKVLQ